MDSSPTAPVAEPAALADGGEITGAASNSEPAIRIASQAHAPAFINDPRPTPAAAARALDYGGGKTRAASDSEPEQPALCQRVESFCINDPTGPGSIGRLPFELRLMVYVELLPNAKAFRVRARSRKDGDGGASTLGLDWAGSVAQPLLTQLCAETREFMLRTGSFIFKTTDTDGGLWWDPEKDILFFDDESMPGPMSALFEGLSGLEHVKHIDLNHRQAMLMETVLLTDTKGAKNGADMQEISFRFKDVSSLHDDEIGLRSNDDGVPTNPDNPPSREPRCEHFIPKHFGHLHSLRISFHDAPWGARDDDSFAAALAALAAMIGPGYNSSATSCRPEYHLRNCDCKAVSFDLRTAPRSKAAAYRQLMKYRDLWSRLRNDRAGFWQEYDARHLDVCRPDAPRLLFYRDPDLEAVRERRALFWGMSTFVQFAQGIVYIKSPMG